MRHSYTVQVILLLMPERDLLTRVRTLEKKKEKKSGMMKQRKKILKQEFSYRILKIIAKTEEASKSIFTISVT